MATLKGLDPKVKFQHGSFRRQLEEARSYHRATRKLPETQWEKFRATTQAVPWYLKLPLLTVLFLLTYGTLFENPLTVRIVTLTGAPPDTEEVLRARVDTYLRDHTVEHNNLLLLNRQNLAAELLRADRSVGEVVSIRKRYPSTVEIKVLLRRAAFFQKGLAGTTVISLDGVTLRELPETARATSGLEGLLELKVPRGAGEETRVDPGLLRSAYGTVERLSSQLKLKTTAVRLTEGRGSDFALEVEDGFSILFDVRTDLDRAEQDFSLLYRNLDKPQLTSIASVDMRVIGRAYVCQRGQPCTEPPPERSKVPSTTPSSSPNFTNP